MKTALLLLFMSAAVAMAQAPAPAPEPAASRCGECGEVRSVRSITKELGEAPANEAKPSGLVATVPLGGGKAKIGSSQRLGKDEQQTSVTWEVIVKLEDGRYRVVVVDRDPGLAIGDKVRVEDGQLVHHGASQRAREGLEGAGRVSQAREEHAVQLRLDRPRLDM